MLTSRLMKLIQGFKRNVVKNSHQKSNKINTHADHNTTRNLTGIIINYCWNKVHNCFQHFNF